MPISDSPITRLVGALGNDILRPNYYNVTIHGPTNLSPDENYLISTTALPAHSDGTVTVPVLGRVLKVNGDRTFPEWTATFYANTKELGQSIREKFIAAKNTGIQKDSSPFQSAPISQYWSAWNIFVTPLDRTKPESAIGSQQTAVIWGFPNDIGEVSLGYDQSDSKATFTVKFEVQHIEYNGVSR